MADQPIKNNKNKDEANEQDISFAVMPHNTGGDLVSEEPLPGSPIAPELNDAEEPHLAIWKSKTTYIVAGILVIAALGGIAYFLLGADKTTQTQELGTEDRLPKVFLQQYFRTDVCNDQAVCGETADPDDDGLNNYDEFVEQTDPKLNDTDGDGLADGDEVNVYLTNPIKKFTDPRKDSEELGYHDGSQIKNEYDPLTPGFKMTDTRKAQVNGDRETHGLHEPTLTTLAVSTPAPKTVTVSITNNKFDSSNIAINIGDTIIWLNKDNANHQIASDPHPTHTDLLDLESGLLATNQTYSYKFTSPGTFNYHDHLNPTIKGTVTVQ